MASKNDLLGSGKVEEEKVVQAVQSNKVPCLMYSPTEVDEGGRPVGVLVKYDDRLEELIKLGYKDHPGKVKELPGFKEVWEAEQKLNNPFTEYDDPGK